MVIFLISCSKWGDRVGTKEIFLNTEHLSSMTH